MKHFGWLHWTLPLFSLILFFSSILTYTNTWHISPINSLHRALTSFCVSSNKNKTKNYFIFISLISLFSPDHYFLVELEHWILVSHHFINSWTQPSRLSLHWRLAAMAASDSNIFLVISFSFNSFFLLFTYCLITLYCIPFLCCVTLFFSIEIVFFTLFCSTSLH